MLKKIVLLLLVCLLAVSLTGCLDRREYADTIKPPENTQPGDGTDGTGGNTDDTALAATPMTLTIPTALAATPMTLTIPTALAATPTAKLRETAQKKIHTSSTMQKCCSK